jgi:hypothetical protein
LEQPSRADVLARWESELLNRPSGRGRLSARYLYEHLFTAVVAFTEAPGEYYRLVRSRTLTGPVDEIVMALPYDAPGKGAVYYRFKKNTGSAAQKTQILWRVSLAKLEHLKQLFLQGDGWPVNVSDPGYGSDNAFENFEQIPGTVRARFMIENSRTIIGAMVQGSVCVGSTATYAISDHFWVWFLKPEADVSAQTPKLGMGSWNALAPPISLLGNRAYQKAYETTLRAWLGSHRRRGLSLTDLWHGEGGDPMYTNGENPNAWLNVTRHEISATVQFGAEGGAPQSIWVLSYSNFERLYYNLVASFKEWGSLKHRIGTWRVMSYIRLEGEDLAISFLPSKHRREIRRRFARGLLGSVVNRLFPLWSLTGPSSRRKNGGGGDGHREPHAPGRGAGALAARVAPRRSRGEEPLA